MTAIAPDVNSIEIEWSSPETLQSCLKELKTGGSVSFSWTDKKIGENESVLQDLCDMLYKSKKVKALDFVSFQLWKLVLPVSVGVFSYSLSFRDTCDARLTPT
jgi:hypothetical protein